jgi:cyclophilin family peptidyl-prolyl cis-trans isomerase
MAEQRKDNVPLPDPDLLQRNVEAALERFRKRRGLYITVGILCVVAVLAVLVIANLPGAKGASGFDRLDRMCGPVRDQLSRDLSAREELKALEAYVEQIRGGKEEGLALWFLAIYHYGEAWAGDKADFSQQRPHFEKALAFLDELRGPRFDELLLAKADWFDSGREPPIEKLRAQVQADLDWASEHARPAPAPTTQTVAVLRTSVGDIHLQFYDELAPEHTKNFLTLARIGTYNATAFHYVRGGPSDPTGIVGGDPYTFFYPDSLKKEHLLRWGQGGVGYGLPPEEARFHIRHGRGIVAGWRMDEDDWDHGSQFLILLSADPMLDRVATPFALVVEGMDVVSKIAARKTAGQHDTFRDDPAFTGERTRDLIVDPVILHKVVVYQDGKALPHDFPLEEGEQALTTLAATPAKPLSADVVYCGRALRSVEAEGEPRIGLDVPYPADVDVEKADPKGERDEGE